MASNYFDSTTGRINQVAGTSMPGEWTMIDLPAKSSEPTTRKKDERDLPFEIAAFKRMTKRKPCDAQHS